MAISPCGVMTVLFSMLVNFPTTTAAAFMMRSGNGGMAMRLAWADEGSKVKPARATILPRRTACMRLLIGDEAGNIFLRRLGEFERLQSSHKVVDRATESTEKAPDHVGF